MYDKEFLTWLHHRLVNVYGENLYFDYMHKLRAIISYTPEDQLTANTANEETQKIMNECKYMELNN